LGTVPANLGQHQNLHRISKKKKQVSDDDTSEHASASKAKKRKQEKGNEHHNQGPTVEVGALGEPVAKKKKAKLSKQERNGAIQSQATPAVTVPNIANPYGISNGQLPEFLAPFGVPLTPANMNLMDLKYSNEDGVPVPFHGLVMSQDDGKHRFPLYHGDGNDVSGIANLSSYAWPSIKVRPLIDLLAPPVLLGHLILRLVLTASNNAKLYWSGHQWHTPISGASSTVSSCNVPGPGYLFPHSPKIQS